MISPYILKALAVERQNAPLAQAETAKQSNRAWRARPHSTARRRPPLLRSVRSWPYRPCITRAGRAAAEGSQ
ncbi:MAG TPA: hypothetical protein VGL39_04985 [Jatrophihabitantaceae bacterium]